MSNTSPGRMTALLGGAVVGLTLLFVGAANAARPGGEYGVDWGSERGQECVDCHMTENPGLYWEWNHSAHGQAGVNCLDCHEAMKDDVDSFEHEEALISIIVTPKDCS